MVKSVAISTTTNNYDFLEGDFLPKDTPTSTPPNGPLTLERPSIVPILHPPKGFLHRIMHNPNAWATQHYNIVEYLTQAPCAMSVLEVLQSYLMQHKSLLIAIGGIDPAKSNFISFEMNCNDSCLSH
jgi:hypothetical protein